MFNFRKASLWLALPFAVAAWSVTVAAKSEPESTMDNVIGVIPGAKGSDEELRQIAQEYGFEFRALVKNGLYGFHAKQGMDRASLEFIADELKRKFAERGVIRESGLIGYDVDKENLTLLPLEFFAKFDEKLDDNDIKQINQAFGAQVVRKSSRVPNLYLLTIEPGKQGVAVISAKYSDLAEVEFAHPNYWKHHTTFETLPVDPFFVDQWHHRNTGQHGGLVDADADTSFAWDFGLGSSSVVIAVADEGFDTTHEDLAANLYSNPGETAGNGIDDDGNGFIDDVNGWDFVSNDNNPVALGAERHGTAVSGVALARGNNGLGVSGSCPNCSWMPLRIANPFISDATMVQMFDYVADMDVDIMNNSWGHTNPASSVSAALAASINSAATSGVSIFFAGGNGNSAGWCVASFPSLAGVIAVSSSTNLDLKVTEAAVGNCIAILSPSHRGYNAPFNGTTHVTTTDRSGAPGYNSANPVAGCPQPEPGNTNYTHCFGGTSSASPLTAGVAGLLKSLSNSLSPTQVRRLIQDTADKIQHSAGSYSANTARSTTNTHAYGRLNAFEATRIVAPVADDGLGGVDIFVRDNTLDWGNTSGYLGQQNSKVGYENPRISLPHWVSPDIKVDAPPYQPAPTAATFDAFVDEKPSLAAGDVNRAYVRVRNRGPVTATDVQVKLMWTQFGAALPALNADFWTQFPNNSALPGNPWTAMNCAGSPNSYCQVASVPYSGASVAGAAGDAAVITQFDFLAPAYDPGLANHFCLLAVTSASNDPVAAQSQALFLADSITPNDNNVTHRNYHNLDTSVLFSEYYPFFIRNPGDRLIKTFLALELDPVLEKQVRVHTEGFKFNEQITLKAGEERLVGVKIEVVDKNANGFVHIAQQQGEGRKIKTLGGLSIEVYNSKKQ